MYYIIDDARKPAIDKRRDELLDLYLPEEKIKAEIRLKQRTELEQQLREEAKNQGKL